MEIKNCQNCGSTDVKRIPPKGEWGKKIRSNTTGNEYFPFVKCDACGWSLSSDPNPRKFTKKPQNGANNANSGASTAKFDELMQALGDIEAHLTAMDTKLDDISASTYKDGRN